MKLVIPGKLPTLNEIIGIAKKHYGSYSSMKKDSTHLVTLYARKLPKVERANFIITWYCQDMRTDKDNIMAGQKFLFDGLVKAGVLENDGWKQIGDITHRFEIDGKNPRVEIEMEELG